MSHRGVWSSCLVWIVVALAVSQPCSHAATSSNTSAAATLYFAPEFGGDSITLSIDQPLVVARDSTGGYPIVRSFSVPPGLALVGSYAQDSLSKHYKVYTSNVSDIYHGIQSWRVVTQAEAAALPPLPLPSNTVIGYNESFQWKANFSGPPFMYLALGDNINSMLPWFVVQSAAIPTGVAVTVFAATSDIPFVYVQDLYYLESYTPVRLRVDRRNATAPSTNLLLFTSPNYHGKSLDLSAATSVPQVAFIADFIPTFKSVKVPEHLVLVAFKFGYYQGERKVWETSDAALDFNFMSFHVFARDSFKDKLSVEPVVPEVRCSIYTFLGQIKDPRGVYRVGSYPLLPFRACTDLFVPDGLVVVGYERPWFLGLPTVWRNSTFLPDLVSYRLRSLRVFHKTDPAIPIATALPKDPNQYFDVGVARYIAGYYKVGDDVPGIDDWATYQWESDMNPRLLEGMEAAFFPDYNFQGTPTVVAASNHRRLSGLFKSIKVRREGSSWSPADLAKTTFVGCYTPWTRVTPTFLGLDDEVAAFLYPWDGYISSLTIPNGLAVFAYSEQDFEGDVRRWTAPTVNVTSAGFSIRSIRVKDLLWTLPPTSAPPTTTRTTATPSTTKAALPVPASSSPSTSATSAPVNVDDTLQEEPAESAPQPSAKPSTSLSVTSPASKSTLSPGPSVSSNASQLQSKASSDATTTSPDAIEPPRLVVQGSPANGLSPVQILLGALAGLVAVAAFIMFVVKRRKQRPSGMVSSVGTAVTCTTQYNSLNWGDLDLIRMNMVPFALAHPLSIGATGSIWLASLHQTPVVVKTFLTANPSEAEVQHLIDEIAFMNSLSSPNIVHLVGAAWTHPSNLQAVVEYMNLDDLREFLAKTSADTFGWQSKLECALSVSEALFYLHSQQMTHRDLKSRNILLDSEKGTKVADFGASKEIVGATMTAAVGTFRWMAPEMLLFQPYTSAVDIYSLGVVLTELTTHEIPFAKVRDESGHELSDDAIAGQVLYNNLRPSCAVDSPEWYQALAVRCMAAEPSDRPSAPEIIYAIKFNIRQLASLSGSNSSM